MHIAKFRVLIPVLAALSLAHCDSGKDPAVPDTQALTYSFESGADGWSAGFADHPELKTPGDSALYELASGREALPSPLDAAKKAFFLQGHNRSDDLFMFMKRKVEGLEPNQDYALTFTLRLASNAATGGVGIGGAPGESVYLKAGASAAEPKPVLNSGFWTMNIDKGNQAVGGAQMAVLGNVANGISEYIYQLITRENATTPFNARTNSQGELWLIIGTDSGFEGKTKLYYDEVKVEVNAVN
ncbi:MAG: hypothetical protein IPH16_02840 [Haliscomenobacter sp.]|nr:hypothetical protein [Haliscomenobacter sp.]MBK7475282.1 hypothetical protein [Haliscomenobacter sp.]MBK8879822.1 hypothetical protein [Haliscomenobacter sp.]